MRGTDCPEQRASFRTDSAGMGGYRPGPQKNRSYDAKNSVGPSRQHAGIDGQSNYRDRNPRKNKTEILEIENTVTEVKNASDGIISRLDKTEERSSELKDLSTASSKTEKQRGQRLGKNRTRQP